MIRGYHFGVEIEMTCPGGNTSELESALTAISPKVEVTGDCSIRTNSSEDSLEARIGVLGYEAVRRILPKVERVCEQYGASVNSSCGLHVHISNKRFFVRKHLSHIIQTWLAIEDVLFATQPACRLFPGNGRTNYCKRRLGYLLSNNAVLDVPKIKEEIRSWAHSMDRYYSLNLNSLYEHGTLECRLHSGTTNATKIKNWIDLLLAVFNYAIERYNPKEVKALFEMETSEDKIAKVFEVLQLSPELKQFYTERIQKMVIKDLATQQKGAVAFMKMLPAYLKARRGYDKARAKLNAVDTERSNYASLFSSNR